MSKDGISLSRLFERRADPSAKGPPRRCLWRRRAGQLFWAVLGVGALAMVAVAATTAFSAGAPERGGALAAQARQAELADTLGLSASRVRLRLWEAYAANDPRQAMRLLALCEEDLARVRRVASELAAPLGQAASSERLEPIFTGAAALGSARGALLRAVQQGDRRGAYAAVAYDGADGLSRILQGREALMAALAAREPVEAPPLWTGLVGPLAGLLVLTGLGAASLYWLRREAEQVFGSIGESLSFRAGMLESSLAKQQPPDHAEVIANGVEREANGETTGFTWEALRARTEANAWQGRAAFEKATDLIRVAQARLDALRRNERALAVLSEDAGLFRALPRELERLIHQSEMAALATTTEATEWSRYGAHVPAGGGGGDCARLGESGAATMEAAAFEMQRVADAGASALRTFSKEVSAAEAACRSACREQENLAGELAAVTQLARELHDLLRQVEASNRGQVETLEAFEAAWQQAPSKIEADEAQRHFRDEVRAMQRSARLLMEHAGTQE